MAGRNVMLSRGCDAARMCGAPESRTGRSDARITGITDDSRASQAAISSVPGGCGRRCARLRGERGGNGAAAALVEHVSPAAGVPQVVTPDGRRGALVAASIVFGDPQDALRIAGVTGTNGKTTSVWMLRHLLSARYPDGIARHARRLPGGWQPSPGQRAA